MRNADFCRAIPDVRLEMKVYHALIEQAEIFDMTVLEYVHDLIDTALDIQD